MANIYVDYINGNNANNGSSWALAKKTLRSAQDVLVSGGDTVYVAKTMDPVDVGSVTLTNGSNIVKFNAPTVTPLFDSMGDSYGNAWGNINATRNEALLNPNPADFRIPSTGAAVHMRTRYINASSNPTMANTLHAMGSLKFNNSAAPNITLPASGGSSQFIVLRVSRNANTRFAVSVNGDEKGTGGVGLYTNQYVTGDGTTRVQRNISRGGQNFAASEFERLGTGSEFIWFDMGSTLLSGTQLNTITIFAVNTVSSQINDYISGVWVVTGMPASINGGSTWADQLSPGAAFVRPGSLRYVGSGLNHVIGSGVQTDGMLPGAQYIIAEDTTGGVRNPAKVSLQTTFNWNGATKTTTTSRFAATVQLNVDESISAGSTGSLFFTVQGGTNTATNLQTGETRLMSVMNNTLSSPGTYKFSPYLRGGRMTGFSLYGFDRVEFRLNNTRVIQNYDFGDLIGNNYGYYVYSDDTTCPSRVFIHYKAFGPNNQVFVDSTMSACSGWSANFTKSFSISHSISNMWNLLIGAGNPVTMSWLDQTMNSYSEFKFGYRKNGGFATTSSVVSSFPALQRNRGFKFTPTTTAAISIARVASKVISLASNAVSSVANVFGLKRGVAYTSTNSVTSPFQLSVLKGVPWSVSGVSALIFSYVPVLPASWMSAETSAIVADIKRNRGYKFLVNESVTVAEQLAVARNAQMTVTETSTVSPKLFKSRLTNLNVVASSAIAVASTRVARFVRPVVNATSSVATSIRRSRVVNAVVNTTSLVSTSIGRSRPVQFTVGTTSAVIENLLRIKAVNIAVTATSGASVRLLRRFTRAWTAVSATSSATVENSTIMRFVSNALSAVSFNLNKSRDTSFAVAEAMAATFGVGVKKSASLSTSATSSASLSLLRDRGYVFSVPMTVNMQASLARLVGNDWMTHNYPVVSFMLPSNIDQGFNVVSQSGNTMVVENFRAIDYAVGVYVSIDGFIIADRNAKAGWGAVSSMGNTVGVGRGVRFELDENGESLFTTLRLVSLSLTSRSQSGAVVRGNSNRLDEFYVQFEQPTSTTLHDGSIIINKSKVVSSGILQDAHPIFETTVKAPDVFEVTISENDRL